MDSVTARKSKPSSDQTLHGDVSKLNNHPMPTRITMRVATALSLDDRFTRVALTRRPESNQRPTAEYSWPHEDQQLNNAPSISQAYDQLLWPQSMPYSKPAETKRRLSDRIGKKNVMDRLGTRNPNRTNRSRPYPNTHTFPVNQNYISENDMYQQSEVSMNGDSIDEINEARGFRNRNRYPKYAVRETKKKKPVAIVRKTRAQLNQDLEQYMSVSHGGRVMDRELDEYLSKRS